MGTAEAQRASESNRAASIFIGVFLAALEEEGVRGGRQRESAFYPALLPPPPILVFPPPSRPLLRLLLLV